MKSCLRRKSSSRTLETASTADSTTDLSVTFDLSRSTTEEIVHLNDVSDEFVDTIWYSEDEYHGMKEEMKPTIQKMMKGIAVEETDEVTCRGLECRTKVGSRSRSRARRQSVQCVLDEQDIQQDEGMPDPEFIATLYSDLTGVRAMEALNRGLKDQRFMLENMDPELQLEREIRSRTEMKSYDGRSPIKKKLRSIPGLTERLPKKEIDFPR